MGVGQSQQKKEETQPLLAEAGARSQEDIENQGLPASTRVARKSWFVRSKRQRALEEVKLCRVIGKTICPRAISSVREVKELKEIICDTCCRSPAALSS